MSFILKYLGLEEIFREISDHPENVAIAIGTLFASILTLVVVIYLLYWHGLVAGYTVLFAIVGLLISLLLPPEVRKEKFWVPIIMALLGFAVGIAVQLIRPLAVLPVIGNLPSSVIVPLSMLIAPLIVRYIKGKEIVPYIIIVYLAFIIIALIFDIDGAIRLGSYLTLIIFVLDYIGIMK